MARGSALSNLHDDPPYHEQRIGHGSLNSMRMTSPSFERMTSNSISHRTGKIYGDFPASRVKTIVANIRIRTAWAIEPRSTTRNKSILFVRH